MRCAPCLAIASLLLACEQGAFEAYPDVERACPLSRVRERSACCPAWMVADDPVCTLRTWSIGSAHDALGEPGARDPEVVLDRDDAAVLAWTVAAADRTEVWTAEETTPGHLRARRPARALAGDSLGPALATSTDGEAIVVWKQQSGSDGRIFAARRPDTGGWHDPDDTDALSWPGNAYEPRAAYGPDGELLIAWNQWTGRNFRVLLSRHRGSELDDPVLVSPEVNHANAPRIAIANNGDAIVTWYQAPGPDLMVFISERTRSDGAWTRPGPGDFVSAAGAPVASDPRANPVVAITERGAAAIAWTQDDGRGGTPVYLATRDSLGELTPPSSLDDAFSAAGSIARDPSLAFGPDGELYVAWSETIGDRHRVVAALRDADGAWIDPGRDPAPLSRDGVDAIEPALAVGPDGEAVVVFAEIVDGVRTIVARRRHVDAADWIAPEHLSDPALGDATEPAAVIGPHGRAFAAWVQGPALLGRVHTAWID